MYAVDYTEVYIELSGTDAEGIDHCDDKFDTWEEAQEALIAYYQNIIQDAKISIKAAKKLRPLT